MANLSPTKSYIAHPDFEHGQHQSVKQHLLSVAELAANLATKLGFSEQGRLIGLMHDFGKFSSSFQNYMRLIVAEQTGYNPDNDEGNAESSTSKRLKGKIDHSSAGAQWVFKTLWPYLGKLQQQDQALAPYGLAFTQALSICIASHHSGLIDSLSENENVFVNRIKKADELTHQNECIKNADPELLAEAHSLASFQFILESSQQLKYMLNKFDLSAVEHDYYLGMFTKMLFSCLIDADRIDSADFEQPSNKPERFKQPDWAFACDKVEDFIAQFEQANPIDHIRAEISDNCFQRAQDETGIYSLTVPTGGGKTYASLRFALHHAQRHNLDRIIYIIPFTSIIEQNANAIRGVLDEVNADDWVLEHHSSLEPEQQTWRSKLACENWDKPIVLTTMVQFLESMFASGTRGSRRMHQLSNAVLVFDEIQTLPIRCVHLFNNTINYLTRFCNTTALMCTATQPLLNQLPEQITQFGVLQLPLENELTPNIDKLYQQLERVSLKNLTKKEGWNEAKITELVQQQLSAVKSCLVIVNTKAWAQTLFQTLQNQISDETKIFHLSTGMCSAHRKQILDEVRARLSGGQATLCISTQLIEAGVDVDFGCVIRFVAGLDSIAQAAGRCNRNGKQQKGHVFVLNPAQENVGMLHDIKTGIAATNRVFTEFAEEDLLKPEAINRYFQYYFYERHKEMTYPIKQGQNILSFLSNNEYIGPLRKNNRFVLNQSFMTAAKQFKAIDAPVHSVIVPFDEEAQSIITQLCALDKCFDAANYRSLLKAAQKYSVNIFPNVWKKLNEQQAVYPISQDEAVFYLSEEFYSQDFGLSLEVTNAKQDLIF
ncbi:CRISPR-associated helicase/endonuclease Cas3 [Vibrio hangzhouensis]|uniref:CRISPR-associated endonuclease/helicase Cas3 n=1 Tax=Vibrio hangzhouensis TaxID=462991 RepID=A0A1H6CMW2_9VIBR|nr:CRISPR-associated helicase/endonuclease Cas3 [Vibrio hangzhouensis]SEG74270.1 CRISPR-associated endonuclease/helicase Cas3 [Vibrio hangzhouensis]